MKKLLQKMFIIFQLFIYASIEAERSSDLTTVEFEKFKLIEKTINDDIIKKTAIYHKIYKIISFNSDEKQKEELKAILKNLYMFLSDKCFNEFLEKHKNNLETHLSQYNKHYIDFHKYDLFNDLEKFASGHRLFTKTKCNSKNYINLIDDLFVKKIDNLKHNTNLLINKYFKRDPTYNSLQLYKLIIKNLKNHEGSYHNSIVFLYENIMHQVATLIEQTILDQFYIKIKKVFNDNLELIYANKFILTEIFCKEKFDINTELDIFLFENAQNCNILYDFYDIIKTSIINDKNFFDFKNINITINGIEKAFTVKLGDNTKKFSFSDQIEFNKDNLVIEISNKEIKEKFFFKIIEIDIQIKYFFLILVEVLETFHKKNFSIELVFYENFCKTQEDVFLIFDKEFFHNLILKTYFDFSEDFIGSFDVNFNNFLEKQAIFISLNTEKYLNTFNNILIENLKNEFIDNTADFFTFSYFIKSMNKFMVFQTIEKEDFYFNIFNDYLYLKKGDKNPNGIDVITNNLIELYQDKIKLGNFVCRLYEKIEKCNQIQLKLKTKLEEVKSKESVPSFFNTESIFNYGKFDEKLIDFDPIYYIFDYMKHFYMNFNNSNKKILSNKFDEYETNILKFIEEICYRFSESYLYSLNKINKNFNEKKIQALENIFESIKSHEEVLSLKSFNFFVRLSLINEKNSKTFLNDILERFKIFKENLKDQKSFNMNNYSMIKDLYNTNFTKIEPYQVEIPVFEEIYEKYEEVKKDYDTVYPNVLNPENIKIQESKSENDQIQLLYTNTEKTIDDKKTTRNNQPKVHQKINIQTDNDTNNFPISDNQNIELPITDNSESKNNKNENITKENIQETSTEPKKNENDTNWIVYGVIIGIGVIIVLIIIILISKK